MKFSALIIMNLINLWHKIFSISSACLMEILIRTELMEASMSTFSFSLRDITTGLRSNSLLVLFWHVAINVYKSQVKNILETKSFTWLPLQVCCAFQQPGRKSFQGTLPPPVYSSQQTGKVSTSQTAYKKNEMNTLNNKAIFETAVSASGCGASADILFYLHTLIPSWICNTGVKQHFLYLL